MLSMGWLLVIFCLSGIWLTTTGNTINVDNSYCGTSYYTDDYTSSDLEYHGSVILYTNPCSVEFTKSSSHKLLCVSASELKIDCQTKLEYHEDFVKNYIEPEKTLTCNNKSVEEWCPSRYTDNIFIVIRKPEYETLDVIELKIYLKDVPDDLDYSSSVSSTIWISLVTPLFLIIMIVALVACRIRARNRAASQRPQVTYQTTPGTVNMLTGPPVNHPAQGFYPSQHSTTPGVQGDYHVHPMQSAYPVTELQSATQQGPSNQQHPSAPAWNTGGFTAPPPSYESVTGKN